MGALNAFTTTWAAARSTFGAGTPVDGSQLDGRAARSGQALTESAARPREWNGSASTAYAAATTAHAARLGTFADLDRRLGAEIAQSADVVAAGRRDLETVRQWVVDAAATVPNSAAGQQLLWSIVNKGVGEVHGVMTRADAEQSEIAERVRALGDEYDLLGTDGEGGAMLKEPTPDTPDLPPTTLDLNDIVYKAPYDPNDKSTWGDPGYMELVPNSGVWVPNPRSPLFRPTPVEKPLDLDDIDQLAVYNDAGERVLGKPGYIELVPESGTWVPDPNGSMWPSAAPTAPVDLTKIEILKPGALGRPWQVELVPDSGVWVPNPHYGAPR